MTKRVIDPAMDGILFTNIYTKGATRLGRLMSNLSEGALEHPEFGRFRTAEGLWYYLKTGCTCEGLRSTNGFESKRLGIGLPVVWRPTFKEDFVKGLRSKVMMHDELREMLVASSLPFEHYYLYGGVDGKVVEPRDVKWLTQFWEDYRTELQM